MKETKELQELRLERSKLDSRIQYLLCLQTSYEGKLKRVEPLSDEFERVVEELARNPKEVNPRIKYERGYQNEKRKRREDHPDHTGSS